GLTQTGTNTTEEDKAYVVMVNTKFQCTNSKPLRLLL
ncbi:hypothetical protein B964_00094, partial [Staphylococcus aureus M0455]